MKSFKYSANKLNEKEKICWADQNGMQDQKICKIFLILVQKISICVFF